MASTAAQQKAAAAGRRRTAQSRDVYGGTTTPSGVYVGPSYKSAGPIKSGKTYVSIGEGQKLSDEYAAANQGARPSWRSVVDEGIYRANNPYVTPAPTNPGVGGGGGGRRGGGGGGGGPAVNYQAQMDYLAGLLGSNAYKAQPLTGMREGIAAATAQDQAAATGAYNALDTYLNANQANPYLNVQMRQAQQAPSMNQYLGTQGVQPLVTQGLNPEDTGYSAFQNVLSLLGAGQTAANQSRLAESQMARTYAGQQIGAMDNAMLMNVSAQEAARQQALDQEKRQALLQLAQLVGQGAVAPAGLY